MDEDISIINSNTRNEKVRNFFIKNKVKIISILLTTVIALISAYSFDKYKTNQKIEISDKFNLTTLTYSENSKDKTVKNLVEIINEKDPTYSPLSLYFIIDNKLISDQEKLNSYFDIIIKNTSLDEEIKNLVIYKKGLFNSEFETENNLIKILSPIINSESIWKSHALYLMAEYFFHKNEKQKSKEFFEKILAEDKSNISIKKEAQKRLNRDFSE